MQRSALRRQSESARHYVDFTATDSTLQTLTALAATTLGFSAAQLNILDEDVQYTRAQHGGPFPHTLPRSVTACQHVVASAGPVAVSDSGLDRFSNDPVRAATAQSLHALSLGSYVAVPLRGREGLIIGTLCVLDTEPHPANEYTVTTLTEFGRVVETHLDALRGHGRSKTAGCVRAVAAAIERGEITPWYQPIVDVSSGAVTAVEALARWTRPGDGTTAPSMVSPADFLPTIEGSDLEIDVDHAVLVRALVDFERWMVDAPEMDLHVNLSARHLAAPDAVHHLIEIVAASAVPAARVVFELTETVSHARPARAHEFVSALQAVGFRVLLDDIGIGFSSLERLVDFPVDGFKIDAGIARTLGTAAGDSLVRALAGFAVDTGRALVVEGIESDHQVAAARHTGCTRVQGFLYSRAVPARDVRSLLD